MFGRGKNKDKKSNPTNSAANIGKGDFPIHTMQDDLSNLSAGAASPGRQVGDFSSDYNSQSETEPNAPQMQDAVPPKKNDSPFLNGPAAASPQSQAEPQPQSQPQIQSESQNTDLRPGPMASHDPDQAPGPSMAPNDEMMEREIATQGVKEEFSLTEEDMDPSKGSGPKVKAKINWKMALVASLFIVCLVIFLGGGYYFWMTRSSVETETTTEMVTEEQEPEPSIEVAPEPEKFSSDNPNYLSLNTEDLNASDIGKILLDTAKEVSAEGNTSPIEFLIADGNGNPIAFHMFANNAGIRLSSEVLDNLEDDFSLYVYDDQGSERLGLAILVSDSDKLKLAMDNEEEAGLVDGLAPLFLGTTYQDENKFFTSGKYREKEVRYINLNPSENLSVDYTIIEKGTNTYLIIGTSMKTNQSVINKISAS